MPGGNKNRKYKETEYQRAQASEDGANDSPPVRLRTPKGAANADRQFQPGLPPASMVGVYQRWAGAKGHNAVECARNQDGSCRWLLKDAQTCSAGCGFVVLSNVGEH